MFTMVSYELKKILSSLDLHITNNAMALGNDLRDLSLNDTTLHSDI